MRKIFVVIAILFFSSVFMAAQKSSATQSILQNAYDVSQTLVPSEIFVGDNAEIRYTFRSTVDFFSDNIEDEVLNVNKIAFEELSDVLTVKSGRFVHNDTEYTITLQILPWRPGVIEFPLFDLYSALNLNESERNKNISYKILFEPIEIKSIVEKTGRSEIQGPHPPLIIPGTSYVIFAIVLFAVIFLSLLFRMIIKFGNFKRWVAHLKIRYAYRRNSIIAMRNIKRLLRTPTLSDIEFCAGLQNITRTYLSFRFDYPFASTSAIGVRKAFNQICFGEIPPAIAYRVEDLTSMFVRTDYIRYAHDSIDSQRQPQSEHQAKLAENERKSLAEMVVKSIKIFESDGQEEANVF